MIKGNHRSVPPCDIPCTSSTAGSHSEAGETGREESRWQPCPPEQWLRDPSDHLESYVDKGITDLPNETVAKIFSNLGIKAISACSRVSKSWKAVIDEHHLRALSFSRDLHYQSIPHTVKDYNSFTRGWLTGFGDEGKKLAEELDGHLNDKHFPQMVFSAIAEVLAGTKHLTCQNVLTAQHNHLVSNASFSLDGKRLVTASWDKTVKICELVGHQWQEKATIEHNDSVTNASFSPDGKYLVTTSKDYTAKIWEFVDGQWQEKATIEHQDLVYASFSPDGKYLVTASDDKTAKISELVGGQWEENARIEYGNTVLNASFSPDGKLLVIASEDNTTTILELVGGQWQEKDIIKHQGSVFNASFSPNGKLLVTNSDDQTARILVLVGGQWQEKTIIDHGRLLGNASFSPDGKFLVTAYSKIAKVWLIKKREEDCLNNNRQS